MHPLPRAVAILALSLSSLACDGKTEQFDLSGQNLLLITIDTLRADRLGSYGYEKAETPHLDRLAREGVRFESAYTSVPLTLPSHTTLFTGRYPFATGVRINGVHFVDEAEVTLAEMFKARGYSTSATVSSYVLTSKFGLDQGFDTYEDSLGSGDLFRFFSEISAEKVYRRFVKWLRQERLEPFFSWVHLYDVHAPYEPPGEYGERFREAPYDGEIAYVDSYIGEILSSLEAEGLLDTTVVIVTSDHGEAFGEHVEEGHGLLCYEEAIRVPLILFAPGRLPATRVVGERVGLVDVTPTVVELFGLEASAPLHGRSLTPFLGRKAQGDTRSVYFESLAGEKEKNWAPRTGLVEGDYKYISVPRAELYNLVEDPGEKENLLRRERQIASNFDEKLRELMLSDAGERREGARELDTEDIEQLRALGYLDSGSGRSEKLLDPKRGIVIEMATRSVRDWIQRGELEAASSELEQLLEENPEVEIADFYILRHEILHQRGETVAARETLERGVATIPDSAMAFKLAAYELELGRLDEAERRAREVLERHAMLSQAVNLLGLIAEKRGDLTGALSHFRQALDAEPRSIPLRLKIAETLVKLRDPSGALEIYEELLSADVLDDQPEALFKAASACTLAGRFERAEELFRRGLELEPAGSHYLGLAMVLLQNGKLDEARTSVETALGAYREDLGPQQIQLAETLLSQWRNAG